MAMIRRLLRRPAAWIAAAAVLIGLINIIFGPWGMEAGSGTGEYLYGALVIVHLFWLYVLVRRDGRELSFALFRVPEMLAVLTFVLFLFSYIYASAANMSYAQRFAAQSEGFSLAPDSTIQRINSALRYLPFLLADLFVYIRFRLYKRTAFAALTGRRGGAGMWGLALSIGAAALYAFSLPSFLSLQGFPLLAFIFLPPLLITFRRNRYGWALLYGVTFGVVQTMLSNYWLGTYSLLSFHFVTLIMLAEYTLFFIPALAVVKRLRRWDFLLLPVMWTAFDYLSASGFLGYPWGMIGTSQHDFLSFIQIASLGGVWMVSFAVLLTGALLTELGERYRAGARMRPAAPVSGVSPAAPLSDVTTAGRLNGYGRRGLRGPAAGLLLMWAAIMVYGIITMQYWEGRQPERQSTVALIQQNTDPRKHSYRTTFDRLTRLTDRAMAADPDLVVWSETAFVPNIRKWSKKDPEKFSLAALVRDFLEYQRSLNTWLVTGNDDYEEVQHPDGTMERNHYNAAVFFSPEGSRMDTYRKLRLVPFSEYFPYKESLPLLYDLLMRFDAQLWDPGEEPVVFHHPDFDFFTPICFEDSFPGDVRRFVLLGADVIVNISNDYWSLTKVEGEQHFVNSIFRAVELRKPLLRSTASGLTAHVTPAGRLVESLPYYEQGVLVANTSIYPHSTTPYLRFGDWFPQLCLTVTAAALLWSLTPQRLRRRLRRPPAD
jgi:apolipoprotein N-acyltransferase